MNEKFGQGLARYLNLRTARLRLRTFFLSSLLVMGAILISIWQGYFNSPTLAGLRNEKMIAGVAETGDYELAAKLYEMSWGEERVLGTNSRLEELVYPSLKVERAIAFRLEFLNKYPNDVETILGLSKLYGQLGNSEMALQYKEIGRQLSPDKN